ncbi:uncharacterized protein LOC111247989 isoform X2 [Varroa destructor]|uniref:Uncharacterized protein n=1 Tax=Varroa destructor TaxID=109461 RepID=A0A7M7M7H7_VARDE|nr:uncharacterized protein LOC111247989 isoform X2 [Varroa destructor]XP_022655380.1 uncharacterized protein LOC111247989 isoform X2 [Varroa destructor]
MSSEIYDNAKTSKPISGGILDGERERRSLEESLNRLRLSKVIEALRRLNQREDFNGALEHLVQQLTQFSNLLKLVDGTPIRNAQPVDTQEFLEQLDQLTNSWRSFDDACPEIITLNKEIESMRKRLQQCEKMVRQTVVNQMLVDI